MLPAVRKTRLQRKLQQWLLSQWDQCLVNCDRWLRRQFGAGPYERGRRIECIRAMNDNGESMVRGGLPVTLAQLRERHEILGVGGNDGRKPKARSATAGSD